MGTIKIAGQEIDSGNGITIEDAMHQNGYRPDSFLYLVDGKPVPMDTIIQGSMVVKAVKVASGG